MGWYRYINYPKEHNVLEKPVAIYTCTGKDYIKANGRKYYYKYYQSNEKGTGLFSSHNPQLRITKDYIEYRDFLATVPGTYYLKEWNERNHNIDPTVYPIYIKGEEIMSHTLKYNKVSEIIRDKSSTDVELTVKFKSGYVGIDGSLFTIHELVKGEPVAIGIPSYLAERNNIFFNVESSVIGSKQYVIKADSLNFVSDTITIETRHNNFRNIAISASMTKDKLMVNTSTHELTLPIDGGDNHYNHRQLPQSLTPWKTFTKESGGPTLTVYNKPTKVNLKNVFPTSKHPEMIAIGNKLIILGDDKFKTVTLETDPKGKIVNGLEGNILNKIDVLPNSSDFNKPFKTVPFIIKDQLYRLGYSKIAGKLNEKNRSIETISIDDVGNSVGGWKHLINLETGANFDSVSVDNVADGEGIVYLDGRNIHKVSFTHGHNVGDYEKLKDGIVLGTGTTLYTPVAQTGTDRWLLSLQKFSDEEKYINNYTRIYEGGKSVTMEKTDSIMSGSDRMDVVSNGDNILIFVYKDKIDEYNPAMLEVYRLYTKVNEEDVPEPELVYRSLGVLEGDTGGQPSHAVIGDYVYILFENSLHYIKTNMNGGTGETIIDDTGIKPYQDDGYGKPWRMKPIKGKFEGSLPTPVIVVENVNETKSNSLTNIFIDKGNLNTINSGVSSQAFSLTDDGNINADSFHYPPSRAFPLIDDKYEGRRPVLIEGNRLFTLQKSGNNARLHYLEEVSNNWAAAWKGNLPIGSTSVDVPIDESDLISIGGSLYRLAIGRDIVKIINPSGDITQETLSSTLSIPKTTNLVRNFTSFVKDNYLYVIPGERKTGDTNEVTGGNIYYKTKLSSEGLVNPWITETLTTGSLGESQKESFVYKDRVFIISSKDGKIFDLFNLDPITNEVVKDRPLDLTSKGEKVFDTLYPVENLVGFQSGELSEDIESGNYDKVPNIVGMSTVTKGLKMNLISQKTKQNRIKSAGWIYWYTFETTGTEEIDASLDRGWKTDKYGSDSIELMNAVSPKVNIPPQFVANVYRKINNKEFIRGRAEARYYRTMDRKAGNPDDGDLSYRFLVMIDDKYKTPEPIENMPGKTSTVVLTCCLSKGQLFVSNGTKLVSIKLDGGANHYR